MQVCQLLKYLNIANRMWARGRHAPRTEKGARASLYLYFNVVSMSPHSYRRAGGGHDPFPWSIRQPARITNTPQAPVGPLLASRSQWLLAFFSTSEEKWVFFPRNRVSKAPTFKGRGEERLQRLHGAGETQRARASRIYSPITSDALVAAARLSTRPPPQGNA